MDHRAPLLVDFLARQLIDIIIYDIDHYILAYLFSLLSANQAVPSLTARLSPLSLILRVFDLPVDDFGCLVGVFHDVLQGELLFV